MDTSGRYSGSLTAATRVRIPQGTPFTSVSVLIWLYILVRMISVSHIIPHTRIALA